jgi:two-component system, NarL family, vancomycin resistance associated response regulator VraR
MLSCERPALRVLVVDDHELTRFSLKLALRKQSGLELVGTASNGQEAVEMTRQHAPDIVILDIQMPILDGLTASIQIKATQPEVQILVYSSLEDAQTERMLQTSQVDAFCKKEIDLKDLLQAVNRLGERSTHKVANDFVDASAVT